MLGLIAVLALAAPKDFSLFFEKDTQLATLSYQKALDTKEVTVEAWFKATPNIKDIYFNYIVGHNYGPLGFGLALHGKEPKIFSQAPGKQVPIGVWTHVALVHSTKATKVYVNGELADAYERSGPLERFEHPLFIGNSQMLGMPGDQRTVFRGYIDEVRIWWKPKTQKQIKETMNRNLTGREHGLLAYFPFNEGKGQVIRDYSGNLISAAMGTGFQDEPDHDPTWAEGVGLKGRLPKPIPRKVK